MVVCRSRQSRWQARMARSAERHEIQCVLARTPGRGGVTGNEPRRSAWFENSNTSIRSGRLFPSRCHKRLNGLITISRTNPSRDGVENLRYAAIRGDVARQVKVAFVSASLEKEI